MDKEVGAIDQAHESLIWSLAWHPIGHILCSGSNDHTSKFWTRNRPGDKMRDKYNLNTLPPGVMPEDAELLDDNRTNPNIPGMGPEDKISGTIEGAQADPEIAGVNVVGLIPGLDVEPTVIEVKPIKKVPYAKPIPKNFQAQWTNDGHSTSKKIPSSILPILNPMSGGGEDDEDYVLGVDPVAFGMEQLGRASLTLFGLPVNDPDRYEEMMDSAQSMPVAELPTPTAVIVDGTILPIDADSELEKAVRSGEDNLHQVLTSMGLKVVKSSEDDESGSAALGGRKSAEPYNRDRELDDDGMFYNYPRSHTPVLDDSSSGFPRGHSGIGPTPTGGLLGDFPRGTTIACFLL